MKLYIKVFSQFIFYLIGTFLHESAHWIGAKITFSQTPRSVIVDEEDDNGNTYKKKISGFTIIPKIKKDRVVYGHVYAIPKYNMFYTIIAAAPLIWFVVLYYLLAYYGFVAMDIDKETLLFQLDYKSLFQFKNWLIFYISLQLIWAGTLSSQDIKMFFNGVFSISFFLFAISGFVIYVFMNPYILNILEGFVNV